MRRDRARRSARSRQRADGGRQSLPATERLLFFGERAAALKWAADGFVTLLQMMVLPYITVSIAPSLGSLRPSELRTLRLRAAAVIGGLWLVALAFAFLIPLTFPSVQNASFFSSSLVERRPDFNPQRSALD